MRRADTILLPPHIMDARFASPELEQSSVEDGADWNFERDVAPYLARLRPSEADTLELFFQRELSQRRIGEILGVTQPAVSQRIRRAKERLRLFRSLPVVTEREAREDLRSVLSRREVRVFLAVTSTHSQRRAAETLGMTTRRLCEAWARIRTVLQASHEERLARYRSLVAAVPRRRPHDRKAT